MGTCVSKCCPSPPSAADSETPKHDKLSSPHSLSSTLTSATTTALDIKPSTTKVHPSPASSHTTTSTSSSSSSASAASSTISSLSSSSCATSSGRPGNPARAPKDRPFSSEFLRACAMDNFDIVVLDPNKPVHGNLPRSAKLQTPAPHARTTVTLRGPPSPRQSAAARSNQPFPSKRARSVSPMSRAGRKSVRTEPSRSNSAASETKNVSKKSLRAVSPCSPSTSQRSSAAEREAFLPRVRQAEAMVHEIETREVFSKKRSRGAPDQSPPHALVEDLNNPLISMDCFIFL